MMYLPRKVSVAIAKVRRTRQPENPIAAQPMTAALKRRAFLDIYADFMGEQSDFMGEPDVSRMCSGSLEAFADVASDAEREQLICFGAAQFLGDYFNALPYSERIALLKALQAFSPETFVKLLKD